MKQSKSLITIHKIAENVRDFEIGPSNVCQYIYISIYYIGSLKTQ